MPQFGLKREQPVEYFPYPILGTGDLWLRIFEMMESALPAGTFRRKERVTGIDLRAHQVYVGGRPIAYSRLISTMPPELPW